MHPTAPGDSWRTWLMTGTQGASADRRRVRGAHRGLKKILIEGMTSGGERSRPWQDFSGAMVRQAVNEALNQLPPDHKQVVRLAYFGGLSNREIAQHLGLSVGGVQRRLRLALARVSDHVEHGRAIGRRAISGVLAWVAARQLVQAIHRAPFAGADEAIRTAAVIATTLVAASALAAQPAPPARHVAARPQAVQAAPAVRPPDSSAAAQPAAPVVVVPPPAALGAAAPAVQVNVPRSLPVSLPPLPSPPVPTLPKLR